MIKPRTTARLALVALALTLWVSAPSFATTIRRYSFEHYVAESTSIVRGRVVSTTPVFPEDGMAYTIASLHVSHAPKSDGSDVAPDKVVEVRIPGARDAKRWVKVHSAPALVPGQDVVLFLWREPVRGHQLVYGWEHGTYHVVRSSADEPESLRGLHAGSKEGPVDFLGRVEAEIVRTTPVEVEAR